MCQLKELCCQFNTRIFKIRTNEQKLWKVEKNWKSWKKLWKFERNCKRLREIVKVWCTYRMYIITPRDQISHDLSYFSGPRTSGAEEKDGCLKSIRFSFHSLLDFKRILDTSVKTYQHSKGYSRGSGECLWCGSLWQTQSRSASAPPGCLQWHLQQHIQQHLYFSLLGRNLWTPDPHKILSLRRDNLLIGSDQLDQLYHFISSRLPIRRSQSFDEDLSPKLGQTGSNTKLEPFFVKRFTLWSCKTKRENQMVQVRAVRLHIHPWFWSGLFIHLLWINMRVTFSGVE